LRTTAAPRSRRRGARASRLDDAVLGPADVAHAQRPVADVCDDEVVELRHALDAPHRAHDELAPRPGRAAAGQLDVLLLDRAPTCPIGEAWRVSRSGST
jgi:hypothetical protein